MRKIIEGASWKNSKDLGEEVQNHGCRNFFVQRLNNTAIDIQDDTKSTSSYIPLEGNIIGRTKARYSSPVRLARQ